MEKKLKNHILQLNLLTMQDLWQVHNLILLIILLKEFVKLSANMDMTIKIVKCVKLNTNIVSAILNT